MANVSIFNSRILVAASGRLCLMILFNIVVQSRGAVASYVRCKISFKCVELLAPNSWFGYRCCSFARVFNSFACTTHAEYNLGIGIILNQAQSLSNLFTESCDYQNVVTRTSDYKYWMLTLVKEIMVLQKMDWWPLHLLQLAMFYNCVWGAIMFTLLNSIINRSKALISLKALCLLQQFSNNTLSCLGSYGYFKLAFFGLQYNGCFDPQYSLLQRTLVHEGKSCVW